MASRRFRTSDSNLDSGNVSPKKGPMSPVRHAAPGSFRQLTGDDLYSATPDRVLGHLDIALLKGKDLQAKAPYVEIHLENHRRRSSHAPKAKTVDVIEWEDARWSLAVTDLAADLHVVLYATHQFRTEKPLGRIIVPLPTLVEDSWSGVALPQQKNWYEVYPITSKIEEKAGCRETQDAYSCKKYLTAVPKWPGSGMAKPAKSIGFVCLEIGLVLHDMSAWTAMLKSTPWWQVRPGGKMRTISTGPGEVETNPPLSSGESAADSQVEIQRAEQSLEINPSTMYVIPRLNDMQGEMAIWTLLKNFRFLLKRNKMRIRRLKTMAPLLAFFFSATLPLSILLCIWAYTTLIAPNYLWPWIGLVLMGVNGEMSQREWLLRQLEAYVVWENEIERRDNADVRLRKLLVLVTKVNIKLHNMLNVIERIPMTWNWCDPLVTRLAYIISIPMCLVISLVLAVVPFYCIVFLVGTGIILKVFRKQEKKRGANLWRDAVLAERKKKALLAERIRSNSVDSDDSDFEGIDGTLGMEEPTVYEPPNPGSVKARGKSAATMAKNFFWLVPDDYELGHRYVASTQRVGVGGATKKKAESSRVMRRE